MITLEILKEADKDWNTLISNCPYGTIYQTKEYATYVESRLKSKPKFLRFFTDSGELIGQLLLFQSFRGQKRLAGTIGRGLAFSYITKLQSILPKFNYWTYGPVILNFLYQNEIFKSLGNYLIEKNMKFYGSPHPLNANFSFAKKFGFNAKENGTFIINLQDNLEQIFKNTDKKSVQKNIKRSQERGVKITQINSRDDLLVYYDILKKFREENNLAPYYYEDVVEGFEFVKKVGQKGFLAWKNDSAVGGLFISTFNGYINEWGIARTQKDYEEKLYSLESLRWKIIEWGVENKCKYYDLSGVEVDIKTSKDAGIYRNKQKWGGELIKYPSWFN